MFYAVQVALILQVFFLIYIFGKVIILIVNSL